MNIKDYLDSTYLKTPEQSGLSQEETWQKVEALTQEAIDNKIFAIMIRPDFVKKVREFLDNAASDVVLGTVISFPEGNLSTEDKLQEAQQAIDDGADELDFVINYHAFLGGNLQGVAEEVKAANTLVLGNDLVIKWIIEAAALNDEQIAQITNLIRTVTEENFEGQENQVFVKSSTGFYQTKGGKPNGATPENITIMLANSGKLPVKAAGGVRTYQEAVEMVQRGVQRIGTSSALAIAQGGDSKEAY